MKSETEDESGMAASSNNIHLEPTDVSVLNLRRFTEMNLTNTQSEYNDWAKIEYDRGRRKNVQIAELAAGSQVRNCATAFEPLISTSITPFTSSGIDFTHKVRRKRSAVKDMDKS